MSEFDREKWNAKYSQAAPNKPSAVLASLADYIPRTGTALDIAGGAGRHSIWLAERGLEVTLVDVSETGIQIANERAKNANVRINTVQQDLDTVPLPAGPFDFVLSICFLCRDVIQQVPEILNPGGRVIVIQPTKSNLQKHNRPPEPFLLNDGELATLLPNLKILHQQESWSVEDRHDAILVAEKPA